MGRWLGRDRDDGPGVVVEGEEGVGGLVVVVVVMIPRLRIRVPGVNPGVIRLGDRAFGVDLLVVRPGVIWLGIGEAGRMIGMGGITGMEVVACLGGMGMMVVMAVLGVLDLGGRGLGLAPVLGLVMRALGLGLLAEDRR